ncbi:MAG: hypothetical protein H5U23_15555 [Phenylobacterium sp.]|nr:hypothetical protein [Phenylobacterium sp.]
MKHLNAFLLNQLLGTPVLLLGAVVLQDLWSWFVTPLGVPALVFWQAAGIIVLIGTFKMNLARHPLKDEDDHPIAATIVRLVALTLGYLMAWGYGVVWHAFMGA